MKKLHKFSIILLMSMIMIFVLSSITFGAEEKLEMWIHSNPAYIETHEEFVEQYEEETGIEIELSWYPVETLADKISTAATSGGLPDLMEMLSRDLWNLIKYDVISQVPEDWMTVSEMQDRYAQAPLAPLLRDNSRAYGIPINININTAPGILYDVDAFKEMGVDPEFEDWDDFIDSMKHLTLTNEDGEIIREAVDFSTGNNTNAFGMFLFQSGGKFYNDDLRSVAFDSEAGVRAVEMMGNFVNKWEVDTLDISSTTSVGKGTATATFYGPWLTAYIESEYPDTNWAFTRVPKIPGAEAPYWASTPAWAWVVPKGENQEMAWDYVKYLSEKENHIKWGDGTSELISVKEYMNEPEICEDPRFKMWVPLVKYQKPINYISGETPKVDSILDDMMQKVWRGRATPEEAVEEAAEKVNRILKRAQ